MPGAFFPPPPVSDLDMHHDTCVTHVPWCMSGSLTSGFLWHRWRGKRSRHSRRMHNPQFYVSGKSTMVWAIIMLSRSIQYEWHSGGTTVSENKLNIWGTQDIIAPYGCDDTIPLFIKKFSGFRPHCSNWWYFVYQLWYNKDKTQYNAWATSHVRIHMNAADYLAPINLVICNNHLYFARLL